jgi:hypothetical protein
MFNDDIIEVERPPESVNNFKPGEKGYSKFTAGLPWTIYAKKKPDLKRHYPEMWGRDLDNHWDPEVHKKPFTVAMKAPDQ